VIATARPRQGWLATQQQVDAWRALGASVCLCRAIRFGIYESPQTPFTTGEVLPEISQSPEDLEFGMEDRREGCHTGIDEEIPRKEAERLRANGLMISNAFTVWQDGAQGRIGRFVVNFNRQSKHWKKGTVKMESLTSFGLDLRQGDQMIPFDI
jgi:hypothetical protein